MKTEAQKVIEAVNLLESRGFVVIDITGPVRRAMAAATLEASHVLSSVKAKVTTNQTLRMNEARFLIGVSKSMFWKMAKEPDFPKRRQLGPRMVAWDRDELEAWLARQPRR